MKTNRESRSNGFKIPDAYFETFEARLKEKQFLDAQHTCANDGFNVPNGYFKLLGRRLEQDLKETKATTLWSVDRRVVASALAAAAVLLLILLWNPKPEQIDINSISATALNEYLSDEGIQDFITEEDLVKIEDNASLFQSFTMSDELLFDVIDDQVLVEELEPQLPQNQR